jgi:hypothetical protein
MAAYRKISVTFWSDSFVQSLTPEGKYFYLYLMTNTRTTQCGIYEITISQMCFETGYNNATIDKLLTQFQKTGKIKYSKETNEIALKNWPKYNESESPKVYACVQKELKSVKNKALIQYLYSMDTQTQETKEETKEEEETKVVIIDDLPFGDDFRRAWDEWIQYKKEKKQKLTPKTKEMQLRTLGAKSEREAIGMIAQSITNGWTGLFDLKQSKNGKQPTASTDEEWKYIATSFLAAKEAGAI